MTAEHRHDFAPEADATAATGPRLMRLATAASMAVAIALIGCKAIAWLISDSVSVLSSLADSSLDLVASLITFFSVRHALTPADREHRFGHGKAEALAGLVQAGFIAASSIGLAGAAINRLLHPSVLHAEMLAVGVMLGSIALTLALVLFQRYVVRRTGSMAIGADSAHYKTDLITNTGVIVALLLSTRFNLGWADGAIAGLISLYILNSAREIGLQSYHVLMDRELDDVERKRIVAIARAHPDVRNVHDLRTRSSGLTSFIQMHLELDGDMTLDKAHIISDSVEADIRAAYPQAEVIIHQDPAGIDEARARFG